MMKNGLTTVQKRLILILGGLLILLGTVIFVFQRNMKQANRLKTDSGQKMNEVNYLSDLQIRVNEMNASQAKTQKEIQKKSQTYPCKMTQQKAISNIYKMSVASGVRLRAIRPQADKTFFKDGKFIVTTGTGDDAEQSTESEETTLSDVEKNPEKKVSVMKMVGNAKTFPMMKQFFTIDGLDDRSVVVKEGDTLSLGSHTLQFVMAPMVHWPEVMVTYEQSEKLLFSADGFGKFGALDVEEDWACEARRYYFNIVGKYGAQVQALLKKAAALDIKMILPLHGPILKEDLGYYLGLYNTWSSYQPESKGVFVAYASIHGNTAKAAEKLGKMLKEKGAEKVVISDLSRSDMAENIEDAFRYDRIVLMASSYDGGVFPVMEDFLMHLKSKNYQNRKIGLVENGSWAPTAARVMKGYVENFKNVTIAEPVVTIRSTLNEASEKALGELAEVMAKGE